MKKTGAEIVMEVLLDHDVDTVFGYPGGAALFTYDALYKYQDRIKHVLTAHEQGAAHAADGYARSTGKTGVVFATSGPGATNLVTGIATAYMDSIPVVAITANVPTSMIGRDAFQEIYITGITMSITKHNFLVNRVEDLEHALREAFRIANTGRKGPVLVDITKDATAALFEYDNKGPLEVPEHPNHLPQEAIDEVAVMLNRAERPVLYVGGGAAASGASEIIAQLIEKADIPVTHTMMAAGIVGYENPRNLGMLGMHGSVASNKSIDKSDLVLALGTRFSDRVALNPEKFAPDAKIVQVDIDRSEVNKNVLVDKAIISDVKAFLEKLLPLVEEKKHEDWMERIEKWRGKLSQPKGEGCYLCPDDLIGTICDMTDKETIYVTDVGQHQMWAAQYLRHYNTRAFLTSGGLGTMGYGYGAAIGAQTGNPYKRVIHLTGDGSFHMNMNEACTAVSNQLPIISVIFDNRVLGMVYQWQNSFYEGRISQTTPERSTNFAKVAEGFGAKGYRVETISQFQEAFAQALKEKGPVWIDCAIDRCEKVLPMIPNGGTVADMILD
ncbi:MAG: biosynthetic-type acetolactate synthase large subunit [Anaerovoracaceae bacterium]